MTLRAILFDKDGTLFDFQATYGPWADRLIVDLSGGDGPRADRMAQAIGFDRAATAFLPQSPVIAGTVQDVAGLLLPCLNGWTADSLVAHLNASALNAPQRGRVALAPLLDRLRGQGLVLGVATNDAEVAAHAHLQAAGVGDRFDFVAGYDSGHGAKPGPGMCLAFAEATRIAPSAIAMVGDSTHDLLAARAAGMVAVGVLTGPALAADLAPHADAILPDIGHLPGWLGL